MTAQLDPVTAQLLPLKLWLVNLQLILWKLANLQLFLLYIWKKVTLDLKNDIFFQVLS